ncbi:KdsC family phosphatase [Trichlorobacter ammonificans]|uniref:3-deoxy-D-manno-octulosonate 8-phosphate phosphatase KdsC n=1 Tax=Trichlorobacter ammonificans TaxID=2916410 RepID=A0ABN8HI98_9BACT|nr:phenylphosphate carboxylase subunit delta [Trichlorobacter ammonificans]CAH2030705.1 3-deoxy-D-manno-octulosonate 8-phosphate phosphatase KdsC [Trichlorobacter ammonificans]
MMEKLKHIELLILDVDGVMTDGRIVWDANGVETKFFNVKDGHGIKLVQRAGIQVGIISGRTSPVVDLRARELGIELVYQGSLQKLESYADMLRRTGLADHQVAYMGDDVIDVPVMRRVAFAAAPCDALPEVRAAAAFVSGCGGGMGAVRELCDLLLKGRGAWEELVVRRYDL